MSWPDPVCTVVDGTLTWNVNGYLHRIDGPAFEHADQQQWWFEGRLHRVDGPAVVWDDGSTEWWLDGHRHRVGGPATEWSNGLCEWWEQGLAHRIDGPAVEYVPSRDRSEDVQWWLYDVHCDWTLQQGQQFMDLTLAAREFVATHVKQVGSGQVWASWEALFASAAEATRMTPAVPRPRRVSPVRSSGGPGTTL